MKTRLSSRVAVLHWFALWLIVCAGASALAQGSNTTPVSPRPQVIASYHNDVSPALRDLPQIWSPRKTNREANENPHWPSRHIDGEDPVIQSQSLLGQLAPNIPAPILNFNGIPYPGVGCACAPPDPNGAVGATQYVQIVNEAYQVFDKITGASILGPNGISSLWSGFGGVCETDGLGDPVVLYDHLANRWLISQFAGGIPTDECIAISTTSDATGTYNRYGFHLGTNYFDYPKLSVWPDAYYMSDNIFNSSGTTYLGPQPFAFDRTSMLAGNAATVITFPPLGGSVAPFLPADLDGSTLPPSGAPNTFVGFPDSGQYIVYHFHVDFVVPSNSTFTTFATPSAAPFTSICPLTRACVPEAGVTSADYLDAIGDRLMFRLAYRNFGTHESVVGNFTVQAGGVAGIRWFELRDVTSGPVTVFQESTYQPDSTWRWMGSIAMNKFGDIALGFSASSAAINPQLRYTGRRVSDPLNTLPQGEAHLFDGTGSQVGSNNRWGDYSAMSVDPVDDTTFWYTNEYYETTSSFNWRTRIGNFRFPAPVRADFNADGNSDVLWQNNATGQRSIWLMNGTVLSTFVNLATLGTAWNIVGSGDFNGDGSPDILWQNNSTGVRVIWLMNGTNFISSVSLGTVGTVWNICGSGDFNADGKADILWQNSSTGARVIWLMDGTTFLSAVPIGTVATVWNIVGSGDFNLDGNTDILWQNNSTGVRTVWLMHGTSFVSSVPIGTLATSWNIGGTGDYNLDGNVDILWQNSITGARAIWLMNGTTFVTSVPFASGLSSSWNIRNF